MKDNTYLEIKFNAPFSYDQQEKIIASLDEIGYEGFWEKEEGLVTYIRKTLFNPGKLHEALNNLNLSDAYTISEMPKRNWNEEWESSFEPVHVTENCLIRAPFHKNFRPCKYEIIIEPKMSFGTGHHATTSLMAEFVLTYKESISGKTILDMGCGTGILAILAKKLGAAGVTAIDIDEWAYENTIENVNLNSAGPVEVIQGDVRLLDNRIFDAIFANINRNILLSDLGSYYKALAVQGLLLISGFLPQDVLVLQKTAENLGLITVKSQKKDNWAAMAFKKV